MNINKNYCNQVRLKYRTYATELVFNLRSAPPPHPQDDPLKYSLCFRNHPANYKYCLIYRELQRRKKPTFKK